MSGSIQNLAFAKVILQIGTDTASENPITGLFIKRAVLKQGGRLVLIDAARNSMDKHAAIKMYAKPGTIGGVVRGMIHHILNANLYDLAAEAANAELFAKIKEDVANHSPEAVAERTGVDADAIKRAAGEFASAETGAIVFGRGLTASHKGYEHSLAVCYLALVAGKVGKPSCGVYPMAYRANEQGACDMGVLPDRLPGYIKVTDEAAAKSLKKAWGSGDISRDPGLTMGEMIGSAADGKLKAMYVMGANPAFEIPGNNQVRDALGKLDLLVVQDIFMNETAELADVILPAATSAEKEGTFTNAERRIQKVNPAIDVLKGTKTDGEIISLVSGKMGKPLSHKASEVMAEISANVPGYGDIDYVKLGVDGIIWPVVSEDGPAVIKPVFHEFTKSGGEGHVCAAEDAAEYPLKADIAVSLYHSGTTTRTSKGPNAVVGEPFAAMNPEEMSGMGLADGDTVKVGSKQGELSLKLKSDRLVPKGTVHIPNHFKGHGLSTLTGLHMDGPNKTPVSRFWPVKIEKV
jgi:predicted molibdopterin-dependent oxidoreductase YjgC